MGYTKPNKYNTSGRYTYFPSGYDNMVDDCAIELVEPKGQDLVPVVDWEGLGDV